MSAANSLVGRDIWMRHTGKDGTSYVMQHRVWNAQLFVETQAADALKVGELCKAEQITEEQFIKERE